jgi:hypothetical protein
MRSKTLPLLALVALATAACGGGDDKEKEAAKRDCAAAAAALSGTPKLPAGFPTPSAVTYTSQKAAGPSQIVSGYYAGDIDAAFDGWKSSFDGTSFDVSKDEHEEVDAEVSFEGQSTSGQVKLLQTCKDRTTVAITVRPK